jgi:peptidoglycan biosynthesis protein MviN/MurJ (putative lipid II flippase)
MLLSSLVLKSSINNFDNNKENFDDSKKKSCVSCIILALILVIIELAVLFFALDIALNTNKSNAAKFVNVVLAVCLTLPYLLLNVLFNPAAQNLLEKKKFF